jgi:hypothetical protein
MRTRRKGRSWWVIACGLVAITIASTASASELDVCVHVLETFTSPLNEYNCGSWGNPLTLDPPDAICFVNPLCCTPGVCKVTPVCGIAKVITETIQEGDEHCFKGISAEELWQRWKDRQIAFGVDLLPCAVNLLLCGVPEALLPFVKADIALIDADGNHLPGHLQELLKEIIAPVYDYGNSGFGYTDIQNVKIINHSRNFNTELWLPDGMAAITLGSVVIVNDAYYHQLMDPANAYTLTALRMGRSTPDYASALSVMIHELVHVKQYRVLGQDTFILNYLAKNAPLITDGYGYDAYESEAYHFTADMLELHGGKLCEWTAPEQEALNIEFSLGRDPVECKPYIAWMIPFL